MAERQAASSRTDTRILALRAEFGALRGELHETTAMSFAMGGLLLPDGKNNAITMRFGHFRDESALALQGAFRLFEQPDTAFRIAASRGLRYGQTGVLAGFVLRW